MAVLEHCSAKPGQSLPKMGREALLSCRTSQPETGLYFTCHLIAVYLTRGEMCPQKAQHRNLPWPRQGSPAVKLKCILSSSASQSGGKATRRDSQGAPQKGGGGAGSRGTPSGAVGNMLPAKSTQAALLRVNFLGKN